MKVVTWKEMFEIKGTVVWSYYNEYEFPDKGYIQYNGDLKGDFKRLCTEDFPITIPDYGYECLDYHSTLDKFNNSKEGVVADLDTAGDIYEEEDSEIPIIIYDKKDIDQWINKLEGLEINY